MYNILFFFLSLILRPPPISTLFPYTTLFRSRHPPDPQPVHPRLPGRPTRRTGRLRPRDRRHRPPEDRKSTRLNSSHTVISYAVFCLKKKTLSMKSSNVPSK